MEIICDTGGADEMTSILVRRAVGDFDPGDVRLVVADATSPYAAELTSSDLVILLYRNGMTPIVSVNADRCRILRRPYAISELENAVRELLMGLPSSYSAENRQTKSNFRRMMDGIETEEIALALFDGKTVTVGGEMVSLTKREGAVFAFLYEHRGEPVPRDVLCDAVWGQQVKTNLCDVYICHLRTKLEPVFGKGFLVNLRHEGYMMNF